MVSYWAVGHFIDSILSKPRTRAVHVTTRSTTESRKIVYGKALVSGPVVYANVANATQKYSPFRELGKDSIQGALLYQVIALAGHRCQRLGSLYLDDVVIAATDLPWGADGGGEGFVSAGHAYKIGPLVQGRSHLGGPDQAADAELMRIFSDVWTAAHRGRGLTYAVVMFQDDKYAREEDLFKSGALTNVAVEVEGKSDIYDPRLDTQPGAHPDNADHQGWSDNPALCWADYLIDPVVGMGLPPHRIDWDAVVTAAHRCDTEVTTRTAWDSHTLDGESTFHPAITEKRYTCNGVLYTRDSHRDNIQALLATMNGAISYTKGKFVVRAYSYQAPVVSISEDDLVGPVEVHANDDQFRAFNAVRGTFIDPDSGYKKMPYPRVESRALITDRDNGQTLYRDLDLPLTNSSTMAQRLAYQQLQQASLDLIATLPLTYKGLKLSVGDRITVTFPRFAWRDKIMQVIRWRFDPLQGVLITVREDDPGAYDDPPAASVYSRRLSVPAIVFVSASDDFTQLRIEPKHVKLAARFLNTVYAHENCGLDQYSALKGRATQLRDYDQIAEAFLKKRADEERVNGSTAGLFPQLIYVLRAADAIRRDDLVEQLDCGLETVNRGVKLLKRFTLLDSTKEGYVKKPKFNRFLRRFLAEQPDFFDGLEPERSEVQSQVESQVALSENPVESQVGSQVDNASNNSSLNAISGGYLRPTETDEKSPGNKEDFPGEKFTPPPSGVSGEPINRT